MHRTLGSHRKTSSGQTQGLGLGSRVELWVRTRAKQAVLQHPQRLVGVLLRPPLRDADMLCERDEKAWPVGSGADPDRGCQVLKVCWPWQACRHV